MRPGLQTSPRSGGRRRSTTSPASWTSDTMLPRLVPVEDRRHVADVAGLGLRSADPLPRLGPDPPPGPGRPTRDRRLPHPAGSGRDADRQGGAGDPGRAPRPRASLRRSRARRCLGRATSRSRKREPTLAASLTIYNAKRFHLSFGDQPPVEIEAASPESGRKGA